MTQNPTRKRAWRPTDKDLVVTEVEVVNGKVVCTVVRQVPVGQQPPDPDAYGRAIGADLDPDTGGIIWEEEVEVDPVWTKTWAIIGKANQQFSNATSDADRDSYLAQALEAFKKCQEVLKWMYKIDPDRSTFAPGIRKSDGVGDFWAYRGKFAPYVRWCAALQWVGNILRHAGGSIRLWELDEKGHPVWKPSSSFPSGDRGMAQRPHNIQGRKFYDDVFCNERRGSAAHITQALIQGSHFITTAAADLKLPMTEEEVWPRENCPYDIEIP
jgi:hypothetical protein